MKETGRYEMAELQDIAECWGDYLEAVFIDEPPYDDRGISDFDDFCRRIAENVSFFEEEFAQGPERPYLEPEQASRQLS